MSVVEAAADVTSKPRRALSPIHRSEHWLPMLFWCLWLLFNWVLARPDEATPPAIRWMLLAIVLGMLLLWPAWQLSLSHVTPRPLRPINEHLQILAHMLGLLAVLQVVLWPLRFTAGWPVEQTLWLSGALSGWLLLVGAVTAWGYQRTTQAGRMVAMLMVVLLVMGEPLLRAAVVLPRNVWGLLTDVPLAGPLRMVQALGAPPGYWYLQGWGLYVWGLLAMGAAMWLVLLFKGFRTRPLDHSAT